MLSRVAEAIYWMNRQVERAENVARFVEVNLNLMLDAPGGEAEQWTPIIATTGDTELFAERYAEPTRERVFEFLTFDRSYPNSILSCFRMARENARSVREVISSEMWLHLNRSYLMVKDAAAAPDVLQQPSEFFQRVRQASQEWVGVTNLTMTHDEAFHFGRLGRSIERADKTSRILDVKYFILLPSAADVGSPFDELQWTALLKSASAFEMYRRRYGRIEPANVVEFLLLANNFPRSVRYCVAQAEDSLRAITDEHGTTGHAALDVGRRLGKLRANLDYADVRDVMKSGLHEHLDALQSQLNGVGEAISATYFASHPDLLP
jgi:uncharacterized alpha-E superfamily protein